ncbi:competence/damage-inducible protein A [Algiphilus aromaticivorans]|uniref:competence/damage-inducible protein A n=1 Tax=Algiphilus aromaticivorans TaxID=382454 RepID=UPI0005C23E6E|nr:molybdopterin-binding protein [Algiphilus aromaticivorans]
MSAKQRVGLLIVGDEILSGKRQDRHLPEIVRLLAARGIDLAWAHIVGDEEAAIAQVLQRATADGDVVLCCGGIGATPDDVTRQAAALAAGCALRRHDEGEALLRAKFGDAAATPERLRMVEFPEGAELIPNPVNDVPGFSLGTYYFVPGFPEMAWPMLEWVIDQRLTPLHNAEPAREYRLRVVGTAGESDLLHLMESLLAAHSAIRLSSLPTRGSKPGERHIELGVRGPASDAATAYRELLAGLCESHPELRIDELAPPPE